MIKDYLKLALNNLSHRRLRSFLTMIGVFIGITAVVALISIGQGMQTAIDEQFKMIGSNRIIVSPGGGGFRVTSNPMMSEFVTAELNDEDVDFIRGIRGVDFAAGFSKNSVKVQFNNKVKYLLSMNIPTDEKSINFLKGVEYYVIDNGRYIKDNEKNKVIIGHEVAYNSFDKEIRVGDNLLIEDKKFEVVGIYKKTGMPIHDKKISLSLDDAKNIFNTGDKIASIFVTVKDGFDVDAVAEKIKNDLRRHRGLKEGEEDFSIATAEQMVGMFKDLLAVIHFVLIGIASISLLVGGVGIMTTMYAAVLERTHEIGVMKAIGAKNYDIGTIFLIESGILGTLGGIIGIILGIGLSIGVEFAAHSAGVDVMKAYVSIELIAGALLFSFIVGTISGFTPAMRASKMKPVDALRKK